MESFHGSMTILVHVLNGLLGAVYLMFVVGGTDYILFACLHQCCLTVSTIVTHEVLFTKDDNSAVCDRWSVQRNAWTSPSLAISFILLYVACTAAGPAALSGR